MKMNARQITLGALLALVCACLGFIVGNKLTSPFNTWLIRGMDIGAAGKYAEIQFIAADPRSALKAQHEMLLHLEHAEKEKGQWNEFGVPWMTTERLRYERALVFSRIAILDERLKNIPEAQIYWVKAENEARQSQWKNPTQGFLRQVIKGEAATYK